MPHRWDWRLGAKNLKNELQNLVIQFQGRDHYSYPVVVGLVDGRNQTLVRDKADFLYGDHAYFNRGWANGGFRLIRNAHHLSHVVKRSDDRLKKHGVMIEPWRKGGRDIVVIPPSEYYWPIYNLKEWLPQTLATLKEVTDRKVHVKHGKGRLRECLLEEHDAHAVVCCISVAGMEAALMGVPVFSTERCCSWPINAGTLENIERPEYPERYEWACGLAYASWHASEFESIDFRDYQYAVKEQPCAS
jgi:hypothetical protein